MAGLRRRVPLAELTTTTFKHAVTRQRPLAGLIHYSDRGSQYAADAFQQCLRAWSVTSSMSRKGNPYDNALAESFVATLKTECFADSIPPTKAAAELMIFDYIETFYNPRRRHSALGYRSPAQFEHHWICSQREGCSGGSLAARPALLSRSALAALAVNNSPELFKPPETTRSNRQRASNAAAKPLTSTKKQRVQSAFSKKDQSLNSLAALRFSNGRDFQFHRRIHPMLSSFLCWEGEQ